MSKPQLIIVSRFTKPVALPGGLGIWRARLRPITSRPNTTSFVPLSTSGCSRRMTMRKRGNGSTRPLRWTRNCPLPTRSWGQPIGSTWGPNERESRS